MEEEGFEINEGEFRSRQVTKDKLDNNNKTNLLGDFSKKPIRRSLNGKKMIGSPNI